MAALDAARERAESEAAAAAAALEAETARVQRAVLAKATRSHDTPGGGVGDVTLARVYRSLARHRIKAVRRRDA